MYGLDRASISIAVAMHMFDLSGNILKHYPKATSNTISSKTMSFDINSKNINKIKIVEKREYRIFQVDFSYPRKYSDNNIIVENDEESRRKTEKEILEVIQKITEEKLKLERMVYDYFEFTTQQEVGSFFHYYNIINFFYRALVRNFKDLDKTQYYNYTEKEDRFYTTGFIFKPFKGWKIRLYGKNFEHNKYHEDKIYGGLIRMEHVLTRRLIKKLFNSCYVTDIQIEEMRREISNSLCKPIFKVLVEEIYRSNEKLEKALQNFKSNDLESIIRDYAEWILDNSIVDDIVTKINTKSYRQLQRYRKKIRIILELAQSRASPKREYFGNIERLEKFINEILLQSCKVECNNIKHFTCKILSK